jgi:cephalosporin-C deacetylase-like acetyl esterase
MKKIFLLLFLLLPVIFAAAADKPAYTSEGKELGNVPAMPLVITTGLNGNPVKCGEKVTFTVIPATPPENAAKIRIFKWLNGIKKETGEYPVKKFTVTMDSAVPAHIMVTGVYIDANGKEISPPPQTAGYGDGVFVAPEKLQKARKRPADFDEFWDNELKKLAAIPMKAKRKLYRQNDLIRCEEVEINSVAGIPVTGFLVIPQKAAPKSLPAVIYFHGAGFKSSSVHEEYKDRAIVFDVNAHGIKNGMPREFYKQLNRKPPADRNVFNHRNDREKSYFKNMFLRTVRAIEFVKTLPEWDGKTIIVAGRSQGGAQAIAAAALSQDVTLCIANVPALADHGAGEVNRAPGWPGINAKKDPAIAAASDYVDIINLASRIKCETIMSIGMIDAICPPISVWLTYQELKVKKDITLFPRLGHVAPPWKFDGRERIKEEISK